jgi:signal transduction histidine kinase
MADRVHRGSATSTRDRWVDRLMLPAVSIAMLAGALFVVVAWAETSDAVEAAERKDEIRAERLASSVDRVLQQRALDLSGWIEERQALLEPNRRPALTEALDELVHAGSSTTTAAVLLVRADGSVVAAAEATPGQLGAAGIADEARLLGRLAAARGVAHYSGRLRLGDQDAFAVAAPGQDGAPERDPLSLVRVTYIERSMIDAFLTDAGSGAVDEAVLLDADGRALVGDVSAGGGEVVRRPVGQTGWSVEFVREPVDPFLPGWAYPMFAMLLVAFAIAYAAQEINRWRLRRRYEQRARTVQSLYELAVGVLQATTIQEQVDGLANAALDLADVDGARVQVQADGAEIVLGTAGITDPTAEDWRVPIEGPRGELGELVVWRAESPFDDAEGWVLQTAATLVGAALDTRVLLESERAVAAELQRLDELRSNLLATVAHELLSPLTAVKGVLGLLSMQDDLGMRGREFVDVATERTDRLVALIRDLFDCSLLETGQLDIRPRRQPAAELLEAALGAQAAARPGELRLSATPNLQINVDPVRFDQLVNNLVTNAFRHGAPPVEVAVRPADGGAVVMVSDEGAGIPPADREEVFDKFWQGSSGHAREAEGAGLGLSLVQGLVRVHGGDITIDSTHADGRGARFIAFFPDDEPAAPPELMPAILASDDGASRRS